MSASAPPAPVAARNATAEQLLALMEPPTEDVTAVSQTGGRVCARPSRLVTPDGSTRVTRPTASQGALLPGNAATRGAGQLRNSTLTAPSQRDRVQGPRSLRAFMVTGNRTARVRRGISFVADVLFVVGIVWLLCLAIAALLGGSQAAAEHAGPLMFGLVFVLPAPMLFCLDALCRRGPPRHQAQGVAPWPAARQPRMATLVARNPSPPSSLGSDDPEFMAPPYEWRDERLPTYEEAIRAPKVEVLAPSLHHETPAAVFYKVPRPEKAAETVSPSP